MKEHVIEKKSWLRVVREVFINVTELNRIFMSNGRGGMEMRAIHILSEAITKSKHRRRKEYMGECRVAILG